MELIQYPKMLYKQGNPRDSVTVNSAADEEALGAEYTDTPVALDEGQPFVPPKPAKAK